MELKIKDKKYQARPEEPQAIEIVKSEDSFLYDSEGKRYTDLVMGWCVGNFGWGNQAITEARQQFSGPEYVYGAFLYKPWVQLAELLAEITPGKDLVTSFRSIGGTQSVEAAMKIAMIYTGRPRFLSVEGAYHGNSLAALSIGSSSNNKTYKNLLPGCLKIESPLDQAAAREVEKVLKRKQIAGFILEPINTHPQIHVPDPAFIDDIRGLCKKYGTLLIADEVAVGFGRTGKIFACEHYSLEPNVLCLSKALSGGNAAIGAAITTEKTRARCRKKIAAYPTYGWHPPAVAATLASVNYLVSNQDSLLRQVEETGTYIEQRLMTINFRKRIRVTRKGLALSVNVGSTSYAKQLVEESLPKGLLIEYSGSHLMLFPALTMGRDVAEAGVKILESCA